MKKVLAILAVLAMTMFSSVAMAEVTMDGSVEFLMRSVSNVSDFNDDTTSATDTYRLTYERVRLGFNAKHEGVKARVQIENDWDTWGNGAGPANPAPGFETRWDNQLQYREAWLDFTIPGAAPAHVKVGRQFLQLGNGWFFRSGKYGSDAWVVGLPGKNTIAFVDVKVSENNAQDADDTDAYVLLDNFKIDDKNTVGAYVAQLNDRRASFANNYFQALFGIANPGFIKGSITNIGLWYSGVVGPVKLSAELDVESGKFTAPAGGTDLKQAGNQIVVQASLPIDALTINATVARGTGDKTDTNDKYEGYLPLLDKDPHYTIAYEYFSKTAAGYKNAGFNNTTGLNIGAMFAINKMFTVGADIWMLTATQKTALNGGAEESTAVGNEVDLKLNVTLYDQLTWNTVYGTFMPGKAYEDAAGKADNVTVLQSVLSYKF